MSEIETQKIIPKGSIEVSIMGVSLGFAKSWDRLSEEMLIFYEITLWDEVKSIAKEGENILDVEGWDLSVNFETGIFSFTASTETKSLNLGFADFVLWFVQTR